VAGALGTIYATMGAVAWRRRLTAAVRWPRLDLVRIVITEVRA
jgi:hypothetical protein